MESLGIMPKLRPLNWSPLGSVTRPCLFPATGNGHDRVPSLRWYMVEILRAGAHFALWIPSSLKKREASLSRRIYTHKLQDLVSSIYIKLKPFSFCLTVMLEHRKISNKRSMTPDACKNRTMIIFCTTNMF